MKRSAGVLVYRLTERGLEVLLVHPGGPFFAKRDLGAWTIPKGEPNEGEDLREAARREFQEETGFDVDGELMPLTPITQKGGKVVHAWAVQGDYDLSRLRSNLFEIEWPPRSGRRIAVPEVDRAGFFTVDDAAARINPAQVALLRELEAALAR